MQPLDISFFKSLSSRYNSVVQAWHCQPPGRPVTEAEFGNLFRTPYGEAASVSKAVTNQEQNTSNNAPIVGHTVCLLNNPRQEQVKTKCISTSISDSQEKSTNYHTNVFSTCPISNKISIPATKTFAQTFA